MPPKSRPPLLQLLLRATLWTPAALALTILLIASWLATVALPLLAVLSFYSGDFKAACIYLASAIPSFLLARHLTKRLWEEPPSLL
jgi:hypothetical protein